MVVHKLASHRIGIDTVLQNSLFNSALKQQSQLRNDLDTFAATPATVSPALQGSTREGSFCSTAG